MITIILQKPINLDGVHFHLEYSHYFQIGQIGESSEERLELDKMKNKDIKDRYNALRGKIIDDSVLFEVDKISFRFFIFKTNSIPCYLNVANEVADFQIE